MATPVQQPTLVGGELAPTLYARTDLERYKQSLALCENFVVDPHGGVNNRQGSTFVGTTKLQDGSTVRLITFAPSAEESYVLEFGHQYLRIFDENGPMYYPGNEPLQVHDQVPPDPLFDGYTTQGFPTFISYHVAQSFIGDAGSAFEIGKIGFKFLRSPGTEFTNAYVAIYDDNAGLPGTVVAGLDFTDFQSMQDLGIQDIPLVGTGYDSVWKYFVLKDQTAGGPSFPAGTVLHAVLRLSPKVGAGLQWYVTFSQGDDYPGGAMSEKQNQLASVWTHPGVGWDLEFFVGNNDLPELIELETPWTATAQDDVGSESQISRLVVTQSIDVMTIVDGTKTHVAYELKRLFGGSWQLDTLQKFVDHGAPDNVTAITNAVAPLRRWDYVVSGVNQAGHEGLPSPPLTVNTGAAISITVPNKLTITVGDEIVNHYVIYKGLDGTYGFIGTAKLTSRTVAERAKAAYDAAYRQYLIEYAANFGGVIPASQATTAFAGAAAAGQAASDAAALDETVIPGVTTIEFHDENYPPDFTDPPRDGANPFTEEGDYRPACVAYFQQRLVFANVNSEPDTLYMSEVSDYQSFQRSIPAVDDDSIKATLAQSQLNEIRFMVPMRDLLVLTTGGEHILTGGGKPIAPSNTDTAPVSHRGCGTLHPLVIGNVILFKDIGGHVREWLYEQTSNDYPATDVSILANHLFRSEDTLEPVKLTEWAHVSSPHSVVTAIRADGLMLTFTYVREQSVAAWARHTTQGKYRSVCSARTISAEGETLYVVVEREIDGVTTWFVEKIETRDNNSVFCDCAIVVGLDSQARNGEPIDEPNWEFQFGGSFTLDTVDQLVEDATCEIRIPKFVLPGSLLVVPIYPDFLGDEKRWIVLYDEDGNRYTMQILSVWPGVGNEDIYQVVLNNDIPAAMAEAPEGSRWELGAKRFVGWDHLVGETVAVRGDDGSHAPLVVDVDGSITLNLIVNTAAAGLPFESTIRTLPLAGDRGDIKTNQKLISRVGVDVVGSRGIWVGETLDDMTQEKPEVIDPTITDTGRVDVRCSSTWNTRGQIYVQNRDPVPCTVSGVSPEVTVGG